MNIKQLYKTSDGKEFETLSAAEQHEKDLIKSNGVGIDNYLSSRSGKRLLENHSLQEYGVWKILGEDPNCDFVGYHHQPYLETVEGRLEDVVKYAVNLKRFYTWGGGGDIVKIEVKEV